MTYTTNKTHMTNVTRLQKGFLRFTKKALIGYLILSIIILSSGLTFFGRKRQG